MIIFRNCSFLDFRGEGYMIDLLNGALLFEDSRIENITTGVFYIIESKVNFTGLFLKNHYYDSSILGYVQFSELFLTRTFMKNITGCNDILILYSENSNVTMKEISLKDVKKTNFRGLCKSYLGIRFFEIEPGKMHFYEILSFWGYLR